MKPSEIYSKTDTVSELMGTIQNLMDDMSNGRLEPGKVAECVTDLVHPYIDPDVRSWPEGEFWNSNELYKKLYESRKAI